jgi:hypothetical protein
MIEQFCRDFVSPASCNEDRHQNTDLASKKKYLDLRKGFNVLGKSDSKASRTAVDEVPKELIPEIAASNICHIAK